MVHDDEWPAPLLNRAHQRAVSLREDRRGFDAKLVEDLAEALERTATVVNKLPLATPFAIDEAAIADARALDLFDHYTRRVAEAVARGETVAVTIGGEVQHIYGPQLPPEGVGPSDPRFDTIVANTEAAKRG